MNYELTLIVGGKATTAKKKAVKELVSTLTASKGGKLTSDADWGEMELAYPISTRIAGKKVKFDVGTYLYYTLEADPSGVKVIDDKLRVEEDIIRHLLVKEEHKHGKKSK